MTSERRTVVGICCCGIFWRPLQRYIERRRNKKVLFIEEQNARYRTLQKESYKVFFVWVYVKLKKMRCRARKKIKYDIGRLPFPIIREIKTYL